MKPFDVSLAFDSGLDDFDRLHAWLDTFPHQGIGLGAKVLGQIRLALAEAVSNAVLHAHGGVAGRPILVRISFVPGPEAQVRLDVTDCGPGFRLPPPATPPEDAESGRGLMILRALSRRIEYSENTLSIWLPSS